jgi:hypothetical protein
LSHRPLLEQVLVSFYFRKVLFSSLLMHFLAHVRSEFRTLIHVKNSVNGTSIVSLGQRTPLSGIDPGVHREDRELKRNCKKSGYDCLDLDVECGRDGVAASGLMSG